MISEFLHVGYLLSLVNIDLDQMAERAELPIALIATIRPQLLRQFSFERHGTFSSGRKLACSVDAKLERTTRSFAQFANPMREQEQRIDAVVPVHAGKRVLDSVVVVDVDDTDVRNVDADIAQAGQRHRGLPGGAR